MFEGANVRAPSAPHHRAVERRDEIASAPAQIDERGRVSRLTLLQLSNGR